MIYLHDSDIGSHGNLSSVTCVIDSRWSCQITDFGLGLFRKKSRKQKYMQIENPNETRDDKLIKCRPTSSISILLLLVLISQSTLSMFGYLKMSESLLV